MRTREQGSIPSFIVVGVLLVAALIGGIVIIKNNIGTNSEESNDTVAQNTDENSGSTDSNSSESSSATDSSSTNDSSANDTSKTDNTNTDSSATQSSNNTNTDSSTLPSGDTGSGLDPGSTSASGVNLPKTGPASTLIGTLGASVLVASVVAFVRSRRV